MFNNILIIGCGLIGSSILRGSISKKISKNIYVFEKSKRTISFIKKINKKIKILKVIDHQVENMDLIVLGTHMSQYKNIIKKLQRFVSSKNIITDTGSTKRNIEKLIDKNKRLEEIFVSSHPIAGSENFGPAASQEKLFSGKRFILTPSENTELDVVERVRGLWQSLGASVSEMDSETHDKMFASVSHLPHLLAYASIQAIANSDTPEALGHSGAGLKDFSRIASSSPEMWADIFLENSHNLQHRINIFKTILSV